MNTDTLTPELFQRWIWLRAVEWLNWPAFLSQLVVPILLIFFSWIYVLAAVVLLGIVWSTMRYRFVWVAPLNSAANIVTWLKWPIAVGSAAYLFIHDQIGVALLALLWPMLAGLIGVPGKIGLVEQAIVTNIGIKSGLMPPT